ncbi:hypothetical protein [Streptomyces beigongshangae]|uniref:hypothetical protein n=1 Tax=Streptomyces beigongshangae TaxID=2841597 RepID=UPI001C848F2C|nr:hypothetical protein [Streptomyces sp. REN17]
MTKSGSDYLKRQAREIASSTGRRFPDVLAELRRGPRTAAWQPSKELVLVCNGMAHPIDGGRCARAAGHYHVDGWSGCSWGPNDAVLVWAGYYEAQAQARRDQEDARRAALTPQERADEDAESEAAYWEEMAEEAREPYDPYDDKYQELVWEAQDEARREAEADHGDAGDPYVDSYLEA